MAASNYAKSLTYVVSTVGMCSPGETTLREMITFGLLTASNQMIYEAALKNENHFFFNFLFISLFFFPIHCLIHGNSTLG